MPAGQIQVAIIEPVSPVYIASGAHIGQNAKFLLPLQSKNLDSQLIRPGSGDL
jgi:hypothetical protein